MTSPAPMMRCASALSTESNLDAAVGELSDDIDTQLGGDTPDIVFAFATHHYGADLARAAGEIVEATGTRALAGCTGAWTLGIGKEAEASPGITVLAATLPKTEIRVTHLSAPAETRGGIGNFDIHDPERASVLLLADPFSFPATPWLRQFHSLYPGVSLAGGLASGGASPGQNILFAGGDPVNSGAIAIVLEGETTVVNAVSQGCRAIGPPLVATKVDRGVVLEFKGQPAAKVLFETLEALDEEDRKLFQKGAFVGRAVNAAKNSFQSGDLLVRSIIGLDAKRHGVAIGDDQVRAGSTLQLMVRDSSSAAAELQSRVELAGLESMGQAIGGLLFTCGGRGRDMFGKPNHDAGLIESHFGPGFPLAGFSASGEIGPVSGEPFLHGFTASAALLVPRSAGIAAAPS